ncbi:PRA1 family protein H-like isoform X2 [Populus alba x Populus x berolinensis]|nr:PRA1 family protein H-like isoform X2 [Populus alba x Populus x berolinensis]
MVKSVLNKRRETKNLKTHTKQQQSSSWTLTRLWFSLLTPLSLSVPDPTFYMGTSIYKTWQRDSAYLRNSSTTTSNISTPPPPLPSTHPPQQQPLAFSFPFFSHALTRPFSLHISIPFQNSDSTDDFSGPNPVYLTRSFFADHMVPTRFPSGFGQARLRVNENVKRHARNYASLFILFFVCTLYQMPLALIGMISSMVLWDIFKFCSDRWGWDRYPVIRQVMVRAAQCVVFFFVVV